MMVSGSFVLPEKLSKTHILFLCVFYCPLLQYQRNIYCILIHFITFIIIRERNLFTTYDLKLQFVCIQLKNPFIRKVNKHLILKCKCVHCKKVNRFSIVLGKVTKTCKMFNCPTIQFRVGHTTSFS